jgi:hypothetical protein
MPKGFLYLLDDTGCKVWERRKGRKYFYYRKDGGEIAKNAEH